MGASAVFGDHFYAIPFAGGFFGIFLFDNAGIPGGAPLHALHHSGYAVHQPELATGGSVNLACYRARPYPVGLYHIIANAIITHGSFAWRVFFDTPSEFDDKMKVGV